MTNEHSWVWSALEGLADLESQRDEAKAECDRLNSRIGEEYDRITAAANCPIPNITATLAMIRAVGSPLDIDHPRQDVRIVHDASAETHAPAAGDAGGDSANEDAAAPEESQEEGRRPADLGARAPDEDEASPQADPLNIPPYLDRRAEAAE